MQMLFLRKFFNSLDIIKPCSHVCSKEIEDIRESCEKVNTKVGEVKMLQNTILSSPAVNLKHQQQMDDLMAEIKKLANGVRSK